MFSFVRKILGYLIGSALVSGLLVGLAIFFLQNWSKASFGISDAEIELNVPKGVSLSVLSQTLENSKLVSSKQAFRVWTKIFSDFSTFKAGIYKLNSPITPRELAAKFIEGSSYQEVKHEVTIPEGFSLNSVIERLVNLGLGNRATYNRLAHDRTFLSTLGIGANSIEGFLYPATYRFVETPTEDQVFKEMVETFWKKLPVGYESITASRGVTMYEAIIISSLIEAETKYDEERNLIAEVIWNRLKQGIPLGIDASTIYGVRNFNGNLTKAHLLDSANPYNLRVHRGLPPTPINSPTISSLKAILTPSEEGYLYYVLSPDSGDRHTFTKSLGEHNQAVARFLNSQK